MLRLLSINKKTDSNMICISICFILKHVHCEQEMEKKRIGGKCNFVEDQNQMYPSEGNTNLTQLLIKAVKILFRLISRYGKGNLISKTACYL